MEVSILNAEGTAAEQDTVVSIRAGSSRRQGTIQLDKKLYFPVGFQDAVPFKIDLLRHVGTAQATILPEDNAYDVPIVPPTGNATNPMKLSFRIGNKPLLCGRQRSENKDKAGPELNKLAVPAAALARRYFDEHNIMRLVQALLEALIRDQPEDPFEYIEAFWGRLSLGKDETQVPLGGAVARDANPQWVNAFNTQDDKGTGTLSVDAFSSAIRAAHPHLSSAQACALGEGLAPGGSGITLATFCAAAEAVAGGSALAAEAAGLDIQRYEALGQAERATEVAVAQGTANSLVELAAEAKAEREGETVQDTMDDPNAPFEGLRASANNELPATNEEGRLDTASEKTRTPPFRFGQEQREATTESLEAETGPLRSAVLGALLAAGQDGRLENTLADIQQRRPVSQGKELESREVDSVPSLEERLRSMALNTLSSASQDGRLQEKLSEVQQKGMDLSVPASEPVAQAADSSEQQALSPRQQELLAQKQSLIEQQRDMQQRLGQLQPVAPAAKASAKQRPGAASAFRELREVHQSLTTENARLNAELARLLARASSSSSLHPS